MGLERYSKVPRNEEPPRNPLFSLILLCFALALLILAKTQLGDGASSCFVRSASEPTESETPTEPSAADTPKTDRR